MPEALLITGPNGETWLLTPELRRKPVRKVDPRATWRRVNADAKLLEERHWIPDLRRFFIDFGETFAKRMGGRSRRISRAIREERAGEPGATKADATKRANAILKEAWDQKSFDDEFVRITEELYDLTAKTALESTGAAMGVSFDLGPSASVKKMVRKRANKLAGHVSDSTYKQVKRNLVRGIEKGEAIPQLAQRVQDAMKHASTHRATVIARTEVMSAYNGSVYEGAQDLPGDVVGGMQWISTNDERTRPAHLDADGQIVELGDAFEVDGEELKYPGDPDGSPENIIQCRCTTAIVTPEEMGSRAVTIENVERVLIEYALGKYDHRGALRELRGG